MARLPLTLSAHPSAWTADAKPGKRQAVLLAAAADSGMGEGKPGNSQTSDLKAVDSDPIDCRFCGQPTGRWHELFHLNDDHADSAPGNLAACCPLCHLPQHLNRPEIDHEAVLVWVPEMAQAAINVLARQIHLALAAAGQSPILGQAGGKSAPAVAYRALHERAAAADMRLGTTSPRQLGAALLKLQPDQYKRRTALLGGIRLLPIGRLFRSGRDRYSAMLRDWRAPDRSPA